MAVSANRLISLIAPERKNELTSLIYEYATLKQKLANPEKQNWYFRKGIESRKKKVAELFKEYESIRKDFRERPIDELIACIAECKRSIESVKKSTGSRMMVSITMNSLTGQINYANFLLRLHSTVDEMHDIEHYLENTEDLQRLADI